jgi:uncharacterized membrane protein YfcA
LGLANQRWLDVAVVAVFFLATLVRATLGFGEALIAVPLLAFALPVEIAAPIATLISITVAAAVTARDWRQIHMRSAMTLVVTSMIGIPIGLLLLHRVPEPIVKGGLGTLVAAFALFSLLNRRPRALNDDRFAWVFGVSAGVLGGAYGMNGPPLVVYGTLRGWTPERFRATLQGYFLPASVMGMIGYWGAGLWTREVTTYYLLTLPAVAVAIALGHRLNRRIDSQRFALVVHAGLLASGVGLVIQSWGHI